MKVRAVWEFDVDTEGLDPKFVDIPGVAKDLTKAELEYVIKRGLLTTDEFEFSVVLE